MQRYSVVLLVLAVGTCGLGCWKGSFVAADADAFGYVSEADLIAHGSWRVEQQFVRTLPWPFADWSFAPAGYRPATTPGFIVPTYPAGVPLLMAFFQRVAGRHAVFYLVPLLGGLCVWMTGTIGAAIHGRLTGTLAALLVATSPAFLTELMAPASDVAAAAWWTTALALTIAGGRLAGLGAGVAASFAILTRPNLVPIAVVVGMFWLWRAFHDHNRRAAVTSLALFAGGAVPGCLAVAAINQHLYGSPLRSGYGPLDALYALANAAPNLDRYPRWLIETQTPFIGLAFAALFFCRTNRQRSGSLATDRVLLLLAVVAVVSLSYLFYKPFGADEWTYLRFLLPAYPPLLVLAVAVLVEILERFQVPRSAQGFGIRGWGLEIPGKYPRLLESLSPNSQSRRYMETKDAPGRAIPRDATRTAAVLMVCLALAGWQARASVQRGAFTARLIERRYVDVGRFVEAALPSNSLLIAGLHAGSIRYYSGRQTLSFDRLERPWLDDAVTLLRGRGFHPYIVVEVDEEPAFRDRFADRNALGRLDWPAAAERREPVRVRIYDPDDRERFQRGETIQTRAIERARRW